MPKPRPTDTTSAPPAKKTAGADGDSGDPYAGTAPAKRPASRRDEDDPET